MSPPLFSLRAPSLEHSSVADFGRASVTPSMKTATLITALSLCSFCSTSVPVSVEVQPGENATLTCANISKYDTMTYWFRLVNRTEVSCVAVLMNSYSKVSYCDGVQKSKFEMTSNTFNLFLEIQQVDVSDTGLYFCGFYIAGIPYFSMTRLTITGGGEEIGKDMPWMTLTLGTLTVFFMVAIIVLVVKIRKLQKAAIEELHPERNKNVGSDDLTRTEWRFLPKTIRSRRSAMENEVETHVVYAATK
ncbi:T cell receptor beta variable 14 [Dissostichus eleginoides]|nr:T cell receptor beta variable 14 [Dissostichus eleginoides]